MSSQLSSLNPTAYVGITPTNPGQNWIRKRDPLTSDFRLYHIGDRWINTDNLTTWTLVNKAENLGIWVGTLNVANIDQITPNTGIAITPLAGNVNLVGDGIRNSTVSIDEQTIQILPLGASGFIWTTTSGPTVMNPNTGYIATNGAGTILTLPTGSLVGAIVAVQGFGAAGWTINQGVGQQILFSGAAATTPGVGGSISSSDPYDAILLVCVAANATWVANQIKGNINVF